MSGGRFAAIGGAHVIGDNLLEFLGDRVALERHCLLTVDKHRRHRDLSRAGQTDADIRHLRFARSIDHTSHHRDGHVLHARVTFAP